MSQPLREVWLVACVLASMSPVAGCARLARDAPRPATSTLACAKSAIFPALSVPSSDDLQHCMAAGSIALRCSVGEAYLVSMAKELRDLVTRGDAQWSDWQADRAGVRCARRSASEAELRACCDAVVAP